MLYFGPGEGKRRVTRLTVALARIIVPAVLLLGCTPATIDTSTPWTASPDGQWLTRVTRSDTAGPGINALYESVELKRRTVTGSVPIFILDEGGLSGDQLKNTEIITLLWSDRSHLRIAYSGGDVLLLVPKIGDLSIEARR